MTGRELPWKVAYYSRADGTKPVEKFLRKLERSRPKDHRQVISKIRLFTRYGLEGASDVGLVKRLRGPRGIFELRVKGFRLYSFTWRDHEDEVQYLMAASAEEKSGRAADRGVIEEAVAARRDWYERHGGGR